MVKSRVGLAITVQDDGPGIPPHEQEQIFTRFYRGVAAKARDIPGAGLGLSIARIIASAHGGHVSVESDGAGTIFHLWLPEAVAPAPTRSDARPRH